MNSYQPYRADWGSVPHCDGSEPDPSLCDAVEDVLGHRNIALTVVQVIQGVCDDPRVESLFH